MKRPAAAYIMALFCLLLSQHAHAQGTLPDSAFYRKALANTRSLYMKNMGADSYLFTGKAYDHYWNGVIGHPFFMTEQLQPGSVDYDGVLYENIPLGYDMNRDDVVTKTFSNNENLALLGEKIRYFIIGTHSFVRIFPDSANASVPATGFYEILYQGITTVLLKHEYKIEKSLKAEDNITKFTNYDRYYIEKDERYHLISGENDLLALLKDQKAEIRKFLRRREINYKKDPSKTIVQTVAYYAQLKK